jgi:hypothetical protein
MHGRRFGSNAATSERRPRRAPQRPTDPARPRRASGARRDRAAFRESRLLFATGVALIIALAAAAFGAEELTQASSSQSRLAALQAELASLQSRVSIDERGAASDRLRLRRVAAQAAGTRRSLDRVSWQLESVPSESEMARVRSELAAYAACIPQLQSELHGLGINWRIDPVKPSADYFKLFTAAPMPVSCAVARTGR